MTDPIADMLSRIRNAAAISKGEVRLPYSQLKAAVARVLHKGGYIAAVETEGANPRQELVLQLAGADHSGQVITEVHRISRPGQRVYAPAGKIPRVLSGRGMVVVSTSSGIMSGEEARRLGVGGELMCRVW